MNLTVHVRFQKAFTQCCIAVRVPLPAWPSIKYASYEKHSRESGPPSGEQINRVLFHMRAALYALNTSA